jgi:hypothetical protein
MDGDTAHLLDIRHPARHAARHHVHIPRRGELERQVGEHLAGRRRIGIEEAVEEDDLHRRRQSPERSTM